MKPLAGQSRLGLSLVTYLSELAVDISSEKGNLFGTELVELVKTLELSPLLRLHQFDHPTYLLRELMLGKERERMRERERESESERMRHEMAFV